MVSASACVGLTLPGMIEDPGSFLRDQKLGKTRTRTAREADVVGDLIERYRKCAHPRELDQCVMRTLEGEFGGPSDKAEPTETCDLGRNRLCKTRGRIDSGPDRRAAERKQLKGCARCVHRESKPSRKKANVGGVEPGALADQAAPKNYRGRSRSRLDSRNERLWNGRFRGISAGQLKTLRFLTLRKQRRPLTFLEAVPSKGLLATLAQRRPLSQCSRRDPVAIWASARPPLRWGCPA
jgi:hypothetical protein